MDGEGVNTILDAPHHALSHRRRNKRGYWRPSYCFSPPFFLIRNNTNSIRRSAAKPIDTPKKSDRTASRMIRSNSRSRPRPIYQASERSDPPGRDLNSHGQDVTEVLGIVVPDALGYM